MIGGGFSGVGVPWFLSERGITSRQSWKTCEERFEEHRVCDRETRQRATWENLCDIDLRFKILQKCQSKFDCLVYKMLNYVNYILGGWLIGVEPIGKPSSRQPKHEKYHPHFCDRNKLQSLSFSNKFNLHGDPWRLGKKMSVSYFAHLVVTTTLLTS